MSTTHSSQQPRGRRTTASQRYPEECKPYPAVPGETMEERVERLDASLTYLTQCFQDEFEVRDEGSLLVNVITTVLLPFAAISAAISLVYVRVVQWTAIHFPNFERAAAAVYLVLLAIVLLGLIVAQRSGSPAFINQLIDRAGTTLSTSVPKRKETLTRNNLVNRWIYLWIVGAVALFIPLTFLMLRSGLADELGVQLVVDTANVCDGPGRIRLFTGSQTCVEILEEQTPVDRQTEQASALGEEPNESVIGITDVADTPLDASVAEIRLDATTTLALAVAILVVGILATMATWWWRNRAVRNIELV